MTKHIFLALVTMLLCSVAFAQANPQQLGWQEFPIAGIDNMFIPYSNPSLLGTENASGLGMVHLSKDEKFVRNYWLFANMGTLSYVYERNEGVNYHMIGNGEEILPAHIFPNLYAGTNYRWEEGKFEDGVFRSGLTYRPLNLASLAFTWDNPMLDSPYYRAGIALRPLALVPSIQDYRLELSADINYAKDGMDYAAQKPILGINTQLFDGIKLGATYNMEKETALLNFSFSSRKMEAGTLYKNLKSANYAYSYVHLTDESFKPFMSITPKSWYAMKANSNVVTYRAPKYTVGPIKIFDKKTRSIDEIIAEIRKAKDDPSINGIMLTNPGLGMSFALQQELVAVFREFKESGKKIAFYYDNISNGGYVFASTIADKIYLNPNGGIDLRGLSINSPYLKDLLNTIGIEPLNFRSHKYKNAGNMFSESEMTPAEREVYDSILQSIFDQMVAQMESGRGKLFAKPVRTLIDEGPYFIADNALKAGLVDKVIYQDELNKTLKADFGFTARINAMEEYRDYSWAKPKETLIATIYACGNIVMGKGTPGQKIAHQTTVEQIRKVRKDPNYKGIILRIDSGGGSAQASDIILRELDLAKTENKKPIVVSMAGVAGSGGYYIAANADKIVANPSTITGSIGVIGLAFNATEMFKKIKVNWSTVKKGEHSDLGVMHRPWTAAEKKLMEDSIEHVYDQFINAVAKGRANLDVDEVHEIAQGRIWTGEQALKNGLVDDLGGMDKAIEHMKVLAKVKGKIRTVDTNNQNSGIQMEIDSNSFMKMLNLDSLELMNREFIELYNQWRDFEGENILMLSPMKALTMEF